MERFTKKKHLKVFQFLSDFFWFFSLDLIFEKLNFVNLKFLSNQICRTALDVSKKYFIHAMNRKESYFLHLNMRFSLLTYAFWRLIIMITPESDSFRSTYRWTILSDHMVNYDLSIRSTNIWTISLLTWEMWMIIWSLQRSCRWSLQLSMIIQPLFMLCPFCSVHHAVRWHFGITMTKFWKKK